jgi:hypothetical protein
MEQSGAETSFHSTTVAYYLRKAGISSREGGITAHHRIRRRDVAKFRRKGLSRGDSQASRMLADDD